LGRCWFAAGVGVLLLLSSGCALPLEHQAECKPSDPDMDIVAYPVTPQCQQKMARLACQLDKCQEQWSWWYIYGAPQIADVDRVLGDLKVPVGEGPESSGSKPWSDRVSWRHVESTCESVKRFCFLGLEEGTKFAAMQCQL
jgi:hypothetical protein